MSGTDIIFLETEVKDLHHVLVNMRRELITGVTFLHGINDYLHKKVFSNFFARAVIQKFDTWSMLLSKMIEGMLLCRKTRAFLLFHMVHDTSMLRGAIIFVLRAPTPVSGTDTKSVEMC